MNKFLRNLGIYFFGGLLGSIGKIATIYLFNSYGIYKIFTSLKISLATYNIFYLLLTGGLWGYLFFLPFKNILFLRGFASGILYSLFTLLYYFPTHGGGFFGINYGSLIWIYIILLNTIWGIIAEIYINSVK